MTAVEIDGELVILDIGADIEKAKLEKKRFANLDPKEAVKKRIIPDDSVIKSRKEDVVAIIIGHGHQDHCLGIPKLAKAYECPIIATPYTISVIQRIVENDENKIENELISLKPGEDLKISDNIDLEFVPVTHSIPQTVLPLLKTCEGTVMYSLDFKFDDEPVLETEVDDRKLRDLGEEDIHALIVDCTRADEPGKANSEVHVKKQLKEIMEEANEEDKGIIITTFSSHIARLKNIIEANENRRKIALLGRSLKEYVEDAEQHSLLDLSDIEIACDPFKMERVLANASEKKSDYMLIATGSQGEPHAILPRIAKDEFPYELSKKEIVIFSSSTIPTSTDRLNSSLLKRRLSKKGVEIEDEVHSHGHAKREDQRKLFRLLKPKTVIPAHGGKEKQSSCASLAREEKIKSIRISKNKETISLD
ncbi:hypothetical protein AKJ56_01385 [candidate division MSBL1 archaeon SCGC-AAA382N08]|uniref:Metallo-beta-lactamase domain-containing protein n=1 Tax=candidate division MSBL1 archaeon SCGC-AAA382N08 TaxID=1698285 RepID=A0A133VPS9_9EURY|nr:hypothetical protein AKJ56_01385 [candidate division MSBL1 archaeon SCGC-AAA382N08]